MFVQTIYFLAPTNLAIFLDDAAEKREMVISKKWGSEDVAMIAAEELTDLLDAVHLVRYSVSTEIFLASLQWVRSSGGTSQHTDTLRKEVGFE